MKRAMDTEADCESSRKAISNSRQDCNSALDLGSAGLNTSRQDSAQDAILKRMFGYRLEGVWPTPSEAVQQDVVRFWLAESALPDLATAHARAPQLLVVARDANGEAAGVSTAIRRFVPQLGFECFYYRTFVGRAHRAKGLRSTQLFWNILQESYRLLNERFIQGCDSGVLGLYAEIENASLMASRNDAVWHENGMNVIYIGHTQDGRHLRVWYFDGVRIP